MAGKLCYITAASSNKLTISLPKSSLNNTYDGKLAKSAGDPSIQTGAYLGTNGFSYRRYDLGAIDIYSPKDFWFTFLNSGNVTNQLF